MELLYEKPCRVRGAYTWRANTKFVPDEKLKIDLNSEDILKKLVDKYGEKLFVESGHKPLLLWSNYDAVFLESKREARNRFFIWFSRIKQWENQRNVIVEYNKRPSRTDNDKENDNIIDFFNLSRKLESKFRLGVKFAIDSYETRLTGKMVSPQYDMESALYKRYTKSEKYLEQTREIKRLAREIAGEREDYSKQAKRIFSWIVKHIRYKFPPDERGVINTLMTRRGDCGEFSGLFVALCRSIGIPARCVDGMWAIPWFRERYHEWAEFYIEDVGWVPVDPSVAKDLKTKNKEFVRFAKRIKIPMDYKYYFGNLDNRRIIFSKGNNILLRNCPKRLSKLGMMEKRRAFSMQPTSIYPFVGGSKNGLFIVDTSEELNIRARRPIKG